MRRLATLVTACALLSSVAAAQAKKVSKQECFGASEEGQLLKVRGQLLAAREQLAVCADTACPRAVRKDCEAGLEELARITPTIVLGAQDAQGSDLTDVAVTVDGKDLVEQLDGKAIAVDPGKRVFRFQAEGLPEQRLEVVVREGEKERIILVKMMADEKPKGDPPPEVEPAGSSPSTTTLVVGGVGAALLVGAGVVGLVALNKRSSLYDRCGKAGTCTTDEVDSVYSLYDVSYVGAGLGGALLATAAVLHFTGSSSSSEPSAKPGVSVAPTLGGVTLWGRF